MKLTQATARHTETEAPRELAPLEDRLGQVEQRISRIEQTPAPPPPAPFDRKVLEAVVGAVDARLKEHAGQVELRLAEMKSALERDQAAISAAQSRMDEVGTWRQERIDATHGELREEIGAVREQQAAVRAALAQIVEERVAQIESRVPAIVEQQLEPLCAQLAAANREIEELKGRIVECRALLLAISAAFRESAQQIARTAVETAPPAAPADRPAGVEATGPAEEPNGPAPSARWTEASGEPAPDGPAEFSPPAFGEPRKPGWRFPVVSSFLLTTAGLVALRLL
jgi:chromosome segregation ATPase